MFLFLMLVAALIFVIFFVSHQFSRQKKIEAIAVIEVKATAYYKPLKGQSEYMTGSYKKDKKLNEKGITFSGEPARVEIVAADLKKFPLNTVLWIPEYGYGIVKDIGGKIRGLHIDLFMGEGEMALQKAVDWGARKTEIYVVKWGSS